MELPPPPPAEDGPPVCCDFTTCCYSGLCALLCFSGVAITFIFSAVPAQSGTYGGVYAQQTWLLGPVLILFSAMVAVKTMLHVRKQRRRAGAVLRRRRRQRCSALPLPSDTSLEPLPRGHELPPSYEEVLKLMREERRVSQLPLPDEVSPPHETSRLSSTLPETLQPPPSTESSEPPPLPPRRSPPPPLPLLASQPLLEPPV